jgi:hypothetical protein
MGEGGVRLKELIDALPADLEQLRDLGDANKVVSHEIEPT